MLGLREEAHGLRDVAEGEEARDGAVKDVVIVVNFSNDLFELERPNRERHGVWDGWAVRIESMPESTTWFPGRDLLYRQSHAFFALRKWWASGSALAAQSLPSEGGLDDLLVTGREVATTTPVTTSTTRSMVFRTILTRSPISPRILPQKGIV